MSFSCSFAVCVGAAYFSSTRVIQLKYQNRVLSARFTNKRHLVPLNQMQLVHMRCVRCNLQLFEHMVNAAVLVHAHI